MAGTESIRDVIAFPKTTTAQCLMTGAPSPVPDAQLAEVHVSVRPKGRRRSASSGDVRRSAARRLDDAPTRCRALGARTFIDTFGHLYPDEDLQAFLRRKPCAPTAYARYLADPRVRDVAGWSDDGEAVGYALAGPVRLAASRTSRPGDGELKRLYVLPSAQNGGWGGRLFEAALDWLERDGPRTLWISVWSENFGAQRFYARHGFEKAGEYEFLGRPACAIRNSSSAATQPRR